MSAGFAGKEFRHLCGSFQLSKLLQDLQQGDAIFLFLTIEQLLVHPGGSH